MTTMTPLPPYPSPSALSSLSLSNQASLTKHISTALLQTLALPPTKRDTPATRTFLSSYARESAKQVLEGLIWENDDNQNGKKGGSEAVIKSRVLLLAEKLAPSGGLDIQTILDLCIVYSQSHPNRFKTILSTLPSLTELAISSDLLSAFTTLLSPANSSGLHGLRKTSHCLLSLLRCSPPQLVRILSGDKSLILALGQAYDEGLAVLARSYGGFRMEQSCEGGDNWGRVWLETKVSLMDSFHILLNSMLTEISRNSGPDLARESEKAFGIIFALLEIAPSTSSVASNTPAQQTPFLNQSLLSDYQHSYSLSRSLSSVFQQVAKDDTRVELLESTLRSLEISSSNEGGSKDPGALKILLRSSGKQPGIDNLGRGRKTQSEPKMTDTKGKGKADSSPASIQDPDLDLKVTQILSILPEHDPTYIRRLFSLPNFTSAESVMEALLEGTAPPMEELEKGEQVEEYEYIKSRKNIFDDYAMDLSSIRVGKKSEDEITFMNDRSFIDQMKADILRRAEAISDSEEEEEEGRVVAFEEELDDVPAGAQVKVAGDGEESSESDGEGEGEAKEPPETVLELAYLRDAKLFERDAQTRRSKGREDLRSQTGWSNEQIEGWKIMLERNPNKDKILRKHEFAGNQPIATLSSSSSHRGDGRGRGRGGGRGGRGRGGRGGGQGGDGSARERAWKDKNKANRGNHNRKRGHDKKMARGGGPSL